MFQAVFPPITRSSKLHIQRQVFVRPILLPAASHLSDQYLTRYVQFWAPGDGRKSRLKHVECLTEINKLRNVASCWLNSANILTMHGRMNVKCMKLVVKIDAHRPFLFCKGHIGIWGPEAYFCAVFRAIDWVVSFTLRLICFPRKSP